MDVVKVTGKFTEIKRHKGDEMGDVTLNKATLLGNGVAYTDSW